MADSVDQLFVSEVLRRHCKKWTYQRELGSKTGYKHYQGRVSMKVKDRQGPVASLLLAAGLSKFKISLTSGENKDNVFYVIKSDETYVEGPWSDTDFFCTETRQVREYRLLTPRPWAVAVEALCKAWNPRSVHLVFDPAGCSGKSLLTGDLHQRQVAYGMPPMDSVEDIMSVALATKAKAYIIDMPRGLTGHKLRSLYTGLESLKNGVAFDKRYTWRLEHFDAPAMVVFTNTLPDFNLLTRDRWKLWTIDHNTWELLPYSEISLKRKREEPDPNNTFRNAFKKWLFSGDTK